MQQDQGSDRHVRLPQPVEPGGRTGAEVQREGERRSYVVCAFRPIETRRFVWRLWSVVHDHSGVSVVASWLLLKALQPDVRVKKAKV